MELGEKIYQLRKQRGLTLEELGQKVGVGKSTVRKWENGMIANMRRDKIAKLAEALGVSPAYLMGWEDESKGYYTNPETAEMAQKLYDNENLRLLFDAAQDATPEDLKITADLLQSLKRKENHEDDD